MTTDAMIFPERIEKGKFRKWADLDSRAALSGALRPSAEVPGKGTGGVKGQETRLPENNLQEKKKRTDKTTSLTKKGKKSELAKGNIELGRIGRYTMTFRG